MKKSIQSTRPFVGRQLEIDRLLRYWEEVTDQNPGKIVFVSGEYGTGKTTLVEQFIQSVTNKGKKNSRVLVGKGNCSFENEEGLLPFNQIFADLTDKYLDWKVDVGKLVDWAAEVAPAWLDVLAAGVGEALITTIKETRKLFKQEKQVFKQEHVFTQFVNAIERMSAHKKLLMVIEDLHWADQSTLSLLFYLNSNLQNIPVMLLCTYRPVEAFETGKYSSQFREIYSNIFDKYTVQLEQGINVEEYVARRYPLNNFPLDLPERIQEHTKGHPIFIDQLFSWWEQENRIVSVVLDENSIMWVTKGVLDLSAPSLKKVDGVINARIRFLNEEMQDILTYGAVEGEVFTAKVIGQLLQIDDRRIYKALRILQNNYRLITQSEHTRQVYENLLYFYQFAHRFIREQVYKELSEPERCELHRQVGECLASLYGDEYLSISGQLALHFEQSGDYFKAARYKLDAANYEKSRYSWLEVKQLCREGLDILKNVSKSEKVSHLEFDLLECLANAHYFEGEFSESEHLYQQLIEKSQSIQISLDRELVIYAHLALACESMEEGITLIDKAFARFEEKGGRIDEAYLELMLAAAILYFANDNDHEHEALSMLQSILEKSIGLEKTSQLRKIIASAHRKIADINYYQGDNEKAFIHYDMAIQTSREINDQQGLAECLINMAEPLIYMNRVEETEKCISQCQEIVDRIGEKSIQVDLLSTTGLFYFMQNNPLEAIKHHLKCIKLAEQIGYTYGLPLYRSDLAEAYLESGQIKLANDQINQALADSDTEFLQAYSLIILGRIRTVENQFEEAERAFVEALQFFNVKEPSLLSVGFVLKHFGNLKIEMKDYNRAFELLDEARSVFNKIGLLYQKEQVEILMQSFAEHLPDSGN